MSLLSSHTSFNLSYVQLQCLLGFNFQQIVDSVSARYIKGAEIDFVDSLMGGGFTVHNPNAVSSCSCGHSFDTGGDGGSARSCQH